MTDSTMTTTSSFSNKWNIGLWVAQIALALLYAMAAYMHLILSPAELVANGVAWAAHAPIALIRFIGLAELAGVLGLILPAVTRIMPKLTVYAAIGLLAIQVLAIPFHITRGEFAGLPFNFTLVVLAVLIIWGRTKKASIAPRA